MDRASFLRQAREGLRMSQAHLAGAAGVSKRTVIRAEQGQDIQDETLRCICSVLGVDARDVPPNAPDPEPVTPRSVLMGVVERNGETLVWEGAADADQWSREVRLGSLQAAHFALLAAGLVALCLYAQVAYDQTRQGLAMDAFSLWAGLAGAALSALALGRVLAGLRGVNRSHQRIRTSLHAMTDSAFYTARRTWWGTRVTSVERVELPEDRGACKVRARSPMWPVSRSIRLPVIDRDGERTFHVEGIPDLDRLASLMRGERAAA